MNIETKRLLFAGAMTFGPVFAILIAMLCGWRG